MTKNPYLNAVFAGLYIVAIVLFITVVLENTEGPDTILAPITMLSLLVLSAATMAYLFFYQPLMMYLEGNKQDAVRFFVKTLAAFAGVTGIVIVALLITSTK